MPSTLAIESLNTVAAKAAQAYLDGVQDNLLDFCDRTRLTGQARTGNGAMSREIPPEVRPELAPRLDGLPVVRDSRQSVDPTCRLTEAVHSMGSGRVRGRESERGRLTLPSEAGGSIPTDSITQPP